MRPSALIAPPLPAVERTTYGAGTVRSRRRAPRHIGLLNVPPNDLFERLESCYGRGVKRGTPSSNAIFDLSTHLLNTGRAVESVECEGQAAKVVVLSRSFPAERRAVWVALTDPGPLGVWFSPVAGELKPGGAYRVEGNASGTIRRCEHESVLDLTWEFGGDISWLGVAVSKDPGGTRLELRHTCGLTPHWEKYGPGAAGVGWDVTLLGLARYLHAPNKPIMPESWMLSAEALAFYRATSALWGEADVLNGSDSVHARAAAERTRAFYSGESASDDPI